MCVYYHASLEKYDIGHTVSVDCFQVQQREIMPEGH